VGRRHEDGARAAESDFAGDSWQKIRWHRIRTMPLCLVFAGLCCSDEVIVRPSHRATPGSRDALRREADDALVRVGRTEAVCGFF
jgi:hypothetical protein